MESPLPYHDQYDEIKSQFDLIFSAIYRTNSNSSEEDIRALNERIQREVTAKPILAKIVQQGNYSLLSACTTCQCEQLHPAIKFLIELNPSALLWPSDTSSRMICNIACHPSHCVLMPWVATHYQWVLDHERCLESPPASYFLSEYANREEESGCTAAIIREFFEAYPQALTQVDEYGCTPLHNILFGEAECEADLFKWMAERCPTNTMLKRNNEGRETPLHRACFSLTNHVGDDLSEICKYLITKCPEPIRILDNDEWLPIHDLLRRCQHQVVKEVVVCLLREYPESYDMAAPTDGDPMPVPSSVPFIQRIKPLLDEERELEENVAYLREVSGLFQDAVDGTDSPSSLASSTCDVFSNWATTTTQRLEAKIKHISKQLQHECNVDEEEDGEDAD